MGRKILLAVACWLALGTTHADATVASAKLEDSVAEASLPRLYRSIPVGVYASASPYASFSFHVPTFASSPKLAHIAGPIKQESVIVENKHGFLKDSYGNKFIESPQSLPYRTAFPQQYVQLQELPAHLAQPLVAAAPSFEYKQVNPSFFGPGQFKVQTVQAASPSAVNHYAINQPYSFGPIRTVSAGQEQQQPKNENAQRLEEIPNPYKQHDREAVAASATTNKGKNAAIELESKPPVPLLDLSLLEPLTFANPLVPQVQHFLPRISSVTYHKLPQLELNGAKIKMKEIMIQKTKSYDSGDIESKQKVNPPRQQQRRPQPDEETEDKQDSPRDVPHDESYELNTPNYQESYNEKFLNYDKETQSEPIHYSYAMKSEKEPISYSYVRSTKEPYKEQAKNVNHNTKYDNNENPKHLIYKFTPEESNEEHNYQQGETEDSSEERSEQKAPVKYIPQNKDTGYDKKSHNHDKPEHREEEHHSKPERIVNKNEEYQRKPDKTVLKNVHHDSPQQHSQIETLSVDNPDAQFQPILQEHEENIRIVPTPKKHASIKVDPSQHVQSENNEPQEPENPDDPPHIKMHIEEKAKSIIITEETPQKGNTNSKNVNEEPAEKERKNEEEFDKGYKYAAYNFPTYKSRDTEREIYNPEPYTPARYNTDFNVENTPFQRYVAESDDFPKSTRSNYKDARDKTKDRYYLDYAISKPESMLARFKEKEDYYKLYMHRKPQYMNSDETEKKNQKQSAKYTAAPGYEYQHAAAQKPKQYFAKYKVAPRPQAYEYNYSKEAPKDNSAHATGPYQRLKTFSQFVEPQFQYGYEQSALPRLLDSELAAMASNNSPESENPLMRKKVYKENWYIKKTSTNGRKAAS